MLDQSFSAKNFEVIFNLQNRMGKIELTTMSVTYQQVLADIKQIKEQISILKSRKKATWTISDNQDFELWNNYLKLSQEQKAQELHNDMEAVAFSVNSQTFRFIMTTHIYDKKDVFVIDTTQRPSFYAIKQLQHNIQRTFKVQQANRHVIMTNLKLLLNTKLPIYIIRTDISHFFESIPQNRLLGMINDNTLLSYKSKTYIKAILNQFESIKNTANIKPGEGIPRGVGISSLLSEIYMRDLDQMILTRKEVVYYARYVDDIFIILTSLGVSTDLNTYYAGLVSLFFQYGFVLKQPIAGGKCELLDFTTGKPQEKEFEYLGYKLCLNMDAKKGLQTEYGLSEHKVKTLQSRINNAFKHFESLSKKNMWAARRDLIDALNIISGNIKLLNAKSGVKVGLFYNNDLLTRLSDLDDLTTYLHSKMPNPYANLFSTTEEREGYIQHLQSRINIINFRERWNSRKLYDFTTIRMKEIAEWL